MKLASLNPMRGIKFLQDVVAELRRITWPTRDSILGGTAAVFLVSGFVTLYIWVLDLIFSRLLAFVLR
ncbi:MAG: preprotein translocase subunit SecE [candidate division WOR-3 bacterium]